MLMYCIFKAYLQPQDLLPSQDLSVLHGTVLPWQHPMKCRRLKGFFGPHCTNLEQNNKCIFYPSLFLSFFSKYFITLQKHVGRTREQSSLRIVDVKGLVG